MQSASDIMLGWFRTPGVDGVERDFYIRQLWDGKGSALVDADGAERAGDLRRDLRLDAGARARPLRRCGGDRLLPRRAATPSTARMATFAEDYADQNERDYAAFQAAVADGRLQAETGL